MKRKQIVSILFLAAAVMAVSPSLTWSQSVGGTQSPPEGKKDSSVGGTQSERSSSDSQTPLSKGSRSAGSNDPSSGHGPRSAFESQGTGRQDVQQAQEALKNQGYDPGPIDGIMGSQTRQAVRDFQSKNGLRQTGMLNAETKRKLNIEDVSSAPSPSSATRPAGSDSMKQKESSSPMSK